MYVNSQHSPNWELCFSFNEFLSAVLYLKGGS